MSIHVEIVTPSTIAHEGECEMVSAPGILGEFGVLDHHAQTLAVTQTGVVTLQTGDQATKFVVGPGFAEVGAGRVTLLVDQCETTDGIDKAAAQADLDAAFAEMATVNTESEEGILAHKRALLAQARLNA
jgi:F-type H+-transporting ATPase subunit epsilon